jgi:hypothetical protein
MDAHQETVRVDFLTKDHGLLGADVTGLAGPIQAARVIVTTGQDARSHVVVWSADAALRLPGDEVVAKLFPSDVVSCVRSDVEGATTLSVSERRSANAVLRSSGRCDRKEVLGMGRIAGDRSQVCCRDVLPRQSRLRWSFLERHVRARRLTRRCSRTGASVALRAPSRACR